jgi:hypothetical protein
MRDEIEQIVELARLLRKAGLDVEIDKYGEITFKFDTKAWKIEIVEEF